MAGKQCPYCAETIQQDAAVCRYCGKIVDGTQFKKCPFCAEVISISSTQCEFCGRNLPIRTKWPISEDRPAETPPGPAVTRDDPPVWLSLVFALFLLATLYVGMFLIALTWGGTYSELETALSSIQALIYIFVGILAAKGKYPHRSGIGKYIAFIFLACLPLINWVVVYYAGKGLARILFRFGKKPSVSAPAQERHTTETVLLILILLSVVVGMPLAIILSTSPSLFAQPAVATPRPTAKQTSIFVPTRTPTFAAAPYHTQAPPDPFAGCTHWSDVTLSMVGRTICAWGEVKYITSEDLITDSGNYYRVYYLTFGTKPSDFYILGYSMYFNDLKTGMCVKMDGKVGKLGNRPVFQIHEGQQIYYWEDGCP